MTVPCNEPATSALRPAREDSREKAHFRLRIDRGNSSGNARRMPKWSMPAAAISQCAAGRRADCAAAPYTELSAFGSHCCTATSEPHLSASWRYRWTAADRTNVLASWRSGPSHRTIGRYPQLSPWPPTARLALSK
jgi:hypothetical protein